MRQLRVVSPQHGFVWFRVKNQTRLEAGIGDSLFREPLVPAFFFYHLISEKWTGVLCLN